MSRTQRNNKAAAKEIRNASGVSEEAVREKYGRITRVLIEKGLEITAMESCTSGQIASLITDTEGASAIMKGAFVTYSNEAKIMAGVPEAVLNEFGVYSSETAAAMADACRGAYGADIGIGVTGSFGNTDPNNIGSIPGELFFAISRAAGTETRFCSIPAQESRIAYKMYAADVIADAIMETLRAAACR